MSSVSFEREKLHWLPSGRNTIARPEDHSYIFYFPMLLSFLLAPRRPDDQTMAENKRTIEDEENLC